MIVFEDAGCGEKGTRVVLEERRAKRRDLQRIIALGNVKGKSKGKSKSKSDGQECPSHTGYAETSGLRPDGQPRAAVPT
jgi:hypothetical protein